MIWRWNKQGFWESHNGDWRLQSLRPGAVVVEHWAAKLMRSLRVAGGYWVRLQSYPDLDKAREHAEEMQARLDERTAAA